MADESKASGEAKRPEAGVISSGDKVAIGGWVLAALVVFGLLIYLLTAGPQ